MAQTFGISWADLPPDLLSLIEKRLDTRIDTLHFRAVCYSWRFLTPRSEKPPPSLPKHILCPINNAPTVSPPMAPFTLFKTKVLRLEVPNTFPKKSWLMKVSEPVENKYRLISPFSTSPVHNLPDGEVFPQNLNLLNLGVSKVSENFFLKNDSPNVDHRISRNFFKVGLSSLFDSNKKFVLIEQTDLLCVTIGENIWRPVERRYGINDFICYKNHFFTVDRDGIVKVVDDKTFRSVLTVPLSLPRYGEWYMVKSRGYLYFVVRDLQSCDGQVFFHLALLRYVNLDPRRPLSVQFKVFKLDDRHGVYRARWREVTDLGDEIFFISRDSSYAFSASDFAGVRGNKIIFVDEIKTLTDYARGLRDHGQVMESLIDGRVRVGVYDLANGSSAPLMALPKYLQMFWPPPAWLMRPPPADDLSSSLSDLGVSSSAPSSSSSSSSG